MILQAIQQWSIVSISLLLSALGTTIMLRIYFSSSSRFEDFYICIAAFLNSVFALTSFIDMAVPSVSLVMARQPLLVLAYWYFMLFIVKQFHFRHKFNERLASASFAGLMTFFVFSISLIMSIPGLAHIRVLTDHVQTFLYSRSPTFDIICFSFELIFMVIAFIYAFLTKKYLLRLAIMMIAIDTLLTLANLIFFNGLNTIFITANTFTTISCQILLLLAMIDFYKNRPTKREFVSHV
jgi:hypothetical protein